MSKMRKCSSNLKGHIYSRKSIDFFACSCGFINEDEFHFFLVCSLYNRPRVTLQNAIGHMEPLRGLTHDLPDSVVCYVRFLITCFYHSL